jgi:hypothetical protein
VIKDLTTIYIYIVVAGIVNKKTNKYAKQKIKTDKELISYKINKKNSFISQ